MLTALPLTPLPCLLVSVGRAAGRAVVMLLLLLWLVPVPTLLATLVLPVLLSSA